MKWPYTILGTQSALNKYWSILLISREAYLQQTLGDLGKIAMSYLPDTGLPVFWCCVSKIVMVLVAVNLNIEFWLKFNHNHHQNTTPRLSYILKWQWLRFYFQFRLGIKLKRILFHIIVILFHHFSSVLYQFFPSHLWKCWFFIIPLTLEQLSLNCMGPLLCRFLKIL